MGKQATNLIDAMIPQAVWPRRDRGLVSLVAEDGIEPSTLGL
jgi:hypothetical protein